MQRGCEIIPFCHSERSEESLIGSKRSFASFRVYEIIPFCHSERSEESLIEMERSFVSLRMTGKFFTTLKYDLFSGVSNVKF